MFLLFINNFAIRLFSLLAAKIISATFKFVRLKENNGDFETNVAEQ
jgi:hypothetical protein